MRWKLPREFKNKNLIFSAIFYNILYYSFYFRKCIFFLKDINVHKFGLIYNFVMVFYIKDRKRWTNSCDIKRKNFTVTLLRVLQTAFMSVTLFISEGYIIYLAQKLCSWICPVYRLAFGGRSTTKSVYERIHAPAIFTHCAAVSRVPLIALIRIVYRLRSPQSCVILS